MNLRLASMLLASVSIALPSAASAQTSPGKPAHAPTSPVARKIVRGPDVTVTFGRDQAVTVRSLNSVAERVVLQPNQTVDVTVDYGADKAGQVIAAEALDGGRVIVPGRALTVASDGTLWFKFQAGATPGTYQVSVRHGSDELGVQFWVLDRERPETNPQAATK